VAWVDASTDETSFVIERCDKQKCTSFTRLTTWPASAGTGSHPWYADCTGLKAGHTYYYRVGAVNAFGVNYSPLVAVTITRSSRRLLCSSAPPDGLGPRRVLDAAGDSAKGRPKLSRFRPLDAYAAGARATATIVAQRLSPMPRVGRSMVLRRGR
jgi:hypothetical protein